MERIHKHHLPQLANLLLCEELFAQVLPFICRGLQCAIPPVVAVVSLQRELHCDTLPFYQCSCPVFTGKAAPMSVVHAP